MEGEVRKLKRGGKEKVLFVFFFVQVVVAVCICQNIVSDWLNTIEGFMKVCVTMFCLHCCSIIVGSLPFICTVKWHVCEPWIN